MSCGVTECAYTIGGAVASRRIDAILDFRVTTTAAIARRRTNDGTREVEEVGDDRLGATRG